MKNTTRNILFCESQTYEIVKTGSLYAGPDGKLYVRVETEAYRFGKYTGGSSIPFSLEEILTKMGGYTDAQRVLSDDHKPTD